MKHKHTNLYAKAIAKSVNSWLCGVETPSKKPRNPWVCLTPEEAYRKGLEDGRKEMKDQQWEIERRKNPLICGAALS